MHYFCIGLGWMVIDILSELYLKSEFLNLYLQRKKMISVGIESDVIRQGVSEIYAYRNEKCSL